jgi:hypothetical protein
VAKIFLKELLRNGTTTALVFGSVHPESVNALFEEAERLDLRLIAGKVMMDRNAPDYLTDTAESGYTESKALIERWHGKGRLHYAVTRASPRPAPRTTGPGRPVAQGTPGRVHAHHLSENLKEIEWVKALFPEQKGYLDVYDHFELLGERSVFAHGVHLCDDECQRLAETGSAVAFCPTSNLFLGSGLFNLPQAERFKVNVGLGTDVGAGTSFSLLNTLNEAYKVMQLQGAPAPVQVAVPGHPRRRPRTAPGRPDRQPAPGQRCRLRGARLQGHAAAGLPHPAVQQHRGNPVRAHHPGRRPHRARNLRRRALRAPALPCCSASCTGCRCARPPGTARRRSQPRSAAPARTATAAAPSRRRTRPARCCAPG